MTDDELMELVQEQMPPHRWQHTLGVIESAIALAERYGANVEKAKRAAILHDIAKYWPDEKQESIIRKHGLPSDLLAHDAKLWHAPVGAWYVEHELHVTDSEVLDAIRFHTSGREQMTLLDKVVCLADYIEPGRAYPAVEMIRSLAEHSLNQALIASFDSTISFLIQQGATIYPLTIMARNDLVLNEAKKTGGSI